MRMKPFDPKTERPMYLQCGCWVLRDDKLGESFGENTEGELMHLTSEEVRDHATRHLEKQKSRG